MTSTIGRRAAPLIVMAMRISKVRARMASGVSGVSSSVAERTPSRCSRYVAAGSGSRPTSPNATRTLAATSSGPSASVTAALARTMSITGR